MKFKSSLAITLLFTIAIINFQCKPDPEPQPTPKAELILGSWQTSEMKRDGVVQPEGAYATYVFAADSTVAYSRYDSNGDVELQFDDIWTFSEDEDRILFEGESEYNVDLIDLTETELTVEYTSVDPFSGNEIKHTDVFDKQ